MQAKANSSRNGSLKDAANVVRFGKKCLRSNLENVVRSLQSKYNCDVKLSVTPDFELVGIFIQDDEMKRLFQAFPEILIVDTTHDFEDLKIPVCILMIEDGNGLSEIVAVGLFVLTDNATFQWFFETLQENNPAYKKTRAIIYNKDFSERDTVKEIFPGAFHFLGLSHSIKSFSHDLVSQHMNIRIQNKNDYKQIFESMCYSRSELDYRRNYKELKIVASTKLNKYFKSNWHSIKNEWVLGITFSAGNFLDKTHDRLEKFNLRMKSIIPSFVSLDEFVDNLFIILHFLQAETDKIAIYATQKVPFENYEVNSTKYKYCKLLTPYAFKLILSQLSLCSEIDLIKCKDGYSVSTTSTLLIKEESCNCSFFRCIRLPCRHIFTLKQKLNASKFDETLCDQRWHQDYYNKCQRALIKKRKDISSSKNTSPSTEIEQPLSTFDKFRDASILGSKLATLVSQSTTDSDFQKKIDFLEALFKNWKEGKKVKVYEQKEVQKTLSSSNDQPCEVNKNALEKQITETVQKTLSSSNDQPCEVTEHESEKQISETVQKVHSSSNDQPCEVTKNKSEKQITETENSVSPMECESETFNLTDDDCFMMDTENYIATVEVEIS